MVSQGLKAAIKLGEDPAYKIAHRAGISSSTLSKLICGIDKVRPGDPRVLAVGRGRSSNVPGILQQSSIAMTFHLHLR